MLYIGTSGYSYKDWIGSFYPGNVKQGDMLAYYSQEFNFTEINSTYYKIPSPYMFFNMQKKTGDDFVFSVKLHQSMTHSRDATQKDYREFGDALDVLKDTGKLGCLVAQFPYSFHYNPENKDYILRLREQLGEHSMVVEFRNSKWLTEETFKLLSDNALGYVCVDEPNLSGLVDKRSLHTADIAYVRFHGRNSNKWWDHNEAYERYDYLYNEKELGEWKEKIEKLSDSCDTCYVSFNNHFNAQAVINGRMLRDMLSLQKGSGGSYGFL